MKAGGSGGVTSGRCGASRGWPPLRSGPVSAPPVERVLLALWVGAVWAIGFIAAPSAFAVLDDRRLAGELASQLFTTTARAGLVAAALILAGALWRGGWSELRRGRVRLVLAMAVLVAVGHFGLTPAMEALRAGGLEPGSVEAVRFSRLHGVASALHVAVAALGLWALAVGESGK